MSSVSFRIIGGVFGAAIGTYFSGIIYDYLYNKHKQNVPQIQNKTNPPQPYENKIKNAQTFEDILHIQVNEHLKQQQTKPTNYEYDNEQGNTFNIIIEKSAEYPEENYINDTLYDNSYYDYYVQIGRE